MIVARRFVRDRTRVIAWWCVGLGAGVLLSIAFYPSFKEQGEALDRMMEDLPEGLKALAGAQGDISLTSPAGFVNSQVFAQVLPIALLVLAIGAGARAIAGAEDDGTLELLMANPITRARVAIERYLGALVNVVVVALVASVVLVGLGPVFEIDIGLANMVGACGAVTCFAVLHMTIAYAIGAVMGGRGMAIAVSSAIGVGGFILYGLVSGDVLVPLRFITPWWWYLSRNILAQGVPPEAILLPLGVSAVLAALGVNRFLARDLRSSG